MAPTQYKRKAHENVRVQKRKREFETIESLISRVDLIDTSNVEDVEVFEKLPLSKPTLAGLEASHFRTMTDIQKRSIPLALKGRDILGAAKTGSGKTLTFLVPVLEKLYRERWGEDHGLAALILSPTRELAIQIFEVLRKIGRYHTFSAGLVIGGKNLQEERERLGRMNILVCTPGRILQHMDQTADLDVGNLKLLVLDEADRIMDMGFQSTVDAVVEHLPKERQTLLFSATQTKKVSDLARLSLKDPEYVSVHEKADTATPATLKQNYIVTPLHEKLDTLWSFLRANTKSKILVFLSSGKQVRFLFETFRMLQPGIPLMHLHGRQKQTARLDVTKRYASVKHACLFATDVVARGLDFPAVDWVIQVDCPEDADTYIHRVGRTARFEREGRAVIFLEPSEEAGMLKRLQQKKIPIEMIKVRQVKQQSIRDQLQERCFKDPEIKYLGQKAFISYVRSIHIQQDKEIFKVQELPLEEFAHSLGLPGAPKIKFQKGMDAKAMKNRSRAQLSSDDEDTKGLIKKDVRTKYDRMFERQNQDVLAPHREKLYDPGERLQGGASSDDGDFLAVKGRLNDFSSDEDRQGLNKQDRHDSEEGTKRVLRTTTGEDIPIDSKRREKMIHSKKAMLKFKERGKKVLFDEDGNMREVYEFDDEDAFNRRAAPGVLREQFVNLESARVKVDDVADKQLVKDKRREKRDKIKARQLATVGDNSGDEEAEGLGGLPLVPFEDPFAETDPEDNGGMGVGSTSDGEIAANHHATEMLQLPDETSDTNETRSKRRRVKPAIAGPQTLEDLEALAKSLL